MFPSRGRSVVAERRLSEESRVSPAALDRRQLGTDAALLDALRENEALAFETLVRRYGNYLYRIALRLARNEAEARDALQDTFLSALRYISDFRGTSSLKTWLHKLTVNATLMRMRSARSREEISIDVLADPIEGVRDEPDWVFVESVEASAARTEVRALVRDSIDRLPERYRTVLILRDIEGYDAAEVAELLGDTEGNVKVRLHRARTALKRLLEPMYMRQAL
jgi:RNA polymerase sigma-70 factor (ECF subfamily)